MQKRPSLRGRQRLDLDGDPEAMRATSSREAISTIWWPAPKRLRLLLDQPDDVPFRVGEQREPHSIRDLLRWLDGLATQSIDLLERRLQVVDADVERHVAGALRRLADPAVDATAVLAMDHGVLQRRIIDRPKRPAERLRIELPKSAGVAPQDLEMDDWIPCCVFHECSLRRHM